MKTSYFRNYGTHPDAVSIALFPPKFYIGSTYRTLAPSQELLQSYRRNLDKIAYVREYDKILSKLNAAEVYDEIHELVDGEPILLCWEGSTKFCHRHLVAKWIKDKLGIDVREAK